MKVLVGTIIVLAFLKCCLIIGSNSLSYLSDNIHRIPLESKNGLSRSGSISSPASLSRILGFISMRYSTDARKSGLLPQPLHMVNEIHYNVKASVGTPPQEIRLKFDSSLPFMWVPTNTNDEYIECHYYYNRSLSKTFKNDGRNYTDVKAPYLIAGTYIKDDVTIVGGTIKQLTFVEASVTSENYEDAEMDGVFGLGFTKSSVDNVENPLNVMVEQKLIDQPVFSILLGDTNELILGGYDPEYVKDKINYVPLTSETKWQIKIDKLEASGVSVENQQAVFQTMTPYIHGPKEMVKAINTALGAQASEYFPGMYEFDCKKVEDIPSVNITINGIGYPLSKEYIMTQVNFLFVMTCYSNFAAIDAEDSTKNSTEENLWIFGDTFVRQYYTIFDQGNSRLGFAQVD